MGFQFRSLVLWFFIGLAASPVWAAKSVVVKRRDVLIYAEPEAGSASVKQTEKGDVLRVSSKQTRNGWYKVLLKTEEGRFGWVRADDVTGSEVAKELRRAGIQGYDVEPKGERSGGLILQVWGGGGLFSPGKIFTSYGIPSQWSMNFEAGGGIGYRFYPSWQFWVEGGYWMGSASGTASPSGTLYSMSFKSIPAALWGEYCLYVSDSTCIGLVLGGGGYFNTTATVSPAGAASTTTQPNMLPFGGGQLSARYALSRGVALQVSLGFKYVASQNPRGLGNGDFSYELMGPNARAGFQFEF